jgi:predicted RNA-binding protein with EMAP domain
MTKKVKEGLGDLAAMAERDHEVQMARADLYKLAKYAIKLHDMLRSVSEAEGIQGWQQAKITTAAEDISSVYHAMDYDMKFAESKSTANVLKRQKSVTETEYTSTLAEKLAERARNEYAIGMAQAMKSTGDNPPLKKSTIKKAHEIAKAVAKS